MEALRLRSNDEQQRQLRLAASRGERMDEIVRALEIEVVLDALRQQAMEAMVDEVDVAKRDRLQIMAKAVGDLKTHIRAGIENGRLARKELEHIASGRKPFF